MLVEHCGGRGGADSTNGGRELLAKSLSMVTLAMINVVLQAAVTYGNPSGAPPSSLSSVSPSNLSSVSPSNNASKGHLSTSSVIESSTRSASSVTGASTLPVTTTLPPKCTGYKIATNTLIGVVVLLVVVVVLVGGYLKWNGRNCLRGIPRPPKKMTKDGESAESVRLTYGRKSTSWKINPTVGKMYPLANKMGPDTGKSYAAIGQTYFPAGKKDFLQGPHQPKEKLDNINFSFNSSLSRSPYYYDHDPSFSIPSPTVKRDFDLLTSPVPPQCQASAQVPLNNKRHSASLSLREDTEDENPYDVLPIRSHPIPVSPSPQGLLQPLTDTTTTPADKVKELQQCTTLRNSGWSETHNSNGETRLDSYTPEDPEDMPVHRTYSVTESDIEERCNNSSPENHVDMPTHRRHSVTKTLAAALQEMREKSLFTRMRDLLSAQPSNSSTHSSRKWSLKHKLSSSSKNSEYSPPRKTSLCKESLDSCSAGQGEGITVSVKTLATRKSQVPPGTRKSETSPGTRKSEIPPGTRKSETPPETRKSETPPGTRKSEIPPGTRKSETPPETRKSETPPGTRKSETPPGTRKSKTPPGTRKSETPPGTRKSETHQEQESRNTTGTRKSETPPGTRKSDTPPGTKKPETPPETRKSATHHINMSYLYND
nr:serine/arginine repetitive matrix protein 1-like [Cherax quadricarinatus]